MTTSGDFYTPAAGDADRYNEHGDPSGAADPGAAPVARTGNDGSALRHLVEAPISTTATRAALREQVITAYPGASSTVNGEHLYLLVERNIAPPDGDDGIWITSHATAAAAVAYHRSQDDPDTWRVVELVDLAGDRRWDGDTHGAWEALPDAVARDAKAALGTRAAVAARTRELLDAYPGAAICESVQGAPWLLVEHNTHPAGDASRWVTGHATADAAVTYHHNQESAEDWTVVELVDADADRHWEADTHPAWHTSALPDPPRTERGAIDYPRLLDQLVEAAGRGNSDQTAHLLHQALVTYGEVVTTAAAGASDLAAGRTVRLSEHTFPAPTFPTPPVDLSAVGANALVPITDPAAAAFPSPVLDVAPIRIRTWDEADTADLPPGSIVAGRNDVYIREGNPEDGDGISAWRCTRTSYVYTNDHIDTIRHRGGQVVRHGYDGTRGPLPVGSATTRLRDLLDALLTAAAEDEFDPDTSIRDEIIARYAAHETDPAPSRDQLTDMLDAVAEEQEPYDPEGTRIGSDYDNGWHEALDAVRNLIDRFPDGKRTPHPDSGQPFRNPDHTTAAGFVVGWCGHRVAGMEYRAGMNTCERDQKDDFRQPATAAAGRRFTGPGELTRTGYIDPA